MIQSPCIKVCKVDMRGICKGCFRTAEEISRWPGASTDEKLKILKAIDDRQSFFVKAKSWWSKL